MVSWFYSLAWWSYILIADSLVYRIAGSSMIMDRPKGFLALLPWSVTIWLVFELFNLSLKNWSYTGVAGNIWLRWPGYVIAYATVLPGMFETYDLLESLGLWNNRRARPLADARRLYAWFMVTGLAMLALSAFFPLYCFPLVWGGFIFLLEPVNHRCGGPSLLREWETGSVRRFWLLMISGLICGLLWEFWNFWAGSKWIYSVPFVGFLKLFEMPLLGFLGFPPFAVECYAMYGAALTTLRLPAWEKGASRMGPARSWQIQATVYGVMAVFWILCVILIDRFTVISFTP